MSLTFLLYHYFDNLLYSILKCKSNFSIMFLRSDFNHHQLKRHMWYRSILTILCWLEGRSLTWDSMFWSLPLDLLKFTCEYFFKCLNTFIKIRIKLLKIEWWSCVNNELIISRNRNIFGTFLYFLIKLLNILNKIWANCIYSRVSNRKPINFHDFCPPP